MPLDMDKLADARRGAHIANILPTLDAVFEEAEGHIKGRMAREIADGTMTPDKAFSAWHEMNAYWTLRRKLSALVKLGAGTEA